MGIASRVFLPVLLVASCMVFFSNIGGLWIYALDEAKNATCAYEMMEFGDQVVPTFNGQLRTDKPPLHYYFMQAGYRLFGFNEFGARFFSSLVGVLTVWLVYFFSRKQLGRDTAQLASIVLLSSWHFQLQMHMAVPDPYLIFFITTAILGLFTGFVEKKATYTYLAYAAIGLGALTKGPIAFALPGLTVLLYLVLFRKFNWPSIKRFRPFSGVALALLIALPWYVAVHLKTGGDWTNGFFFKHNFDRFSSTMEGHGGIFLLTWGFVLMGMIPFIPYFFSGIGYWWKNRSHEFIGFILCAVLAIVGFFTISSTKLPNYTVPAYPFLSILIAFYLSHIIRKNTADWKSRLAAVAVVFLSLALPIAVYFALISQPELAGTASAAFWLIIYPAGALVSAWFLFKNRIRSAVAVIVIAYWLNNMLFFYVALPKVDRYNPVAQTSAPIYQDKFPLLCYRSMNPAFVFYAKAPIPVYHTVEDLMEALREYPKAYVLARSGNREILEELTPLKFKESHQDLFESPRTIVMEYSQEHDQ